MTSTPVRPMGCTFYQCWMEIIARSWWPVLGPMRVFFVLSADLPVFLVALI